MSVKGTLYYAHRLAYCRANQLDIDAFTLGGGVVRHKCDNPRCVNPDHLILGTVADNNRDRSIRRRSANLKLTDAQVEHIRDHACPRPRGSNTQHPGSYAALARLFGVNMRTVRAAHLGLSFAHLGEQTCKN